jgi:hypothetical protein
MPFLNPSVFFHLITNVNIAVINADLDILSPDDSLSSSSAISTGTEKDNVVVFFIINHLLVKYNSIKVVDSQYF